GAGFSPFTITEPDFTPPPDPIDPTELGRTPPEPDPVSDPIEVEGVPPGPTITVTTETEIPKDGEGNGTRIQPGTQPEGFGFEDLQPNQHLGDTDEAPTQLFLTFTPQDSQVLTSVVIGNIPTGVKLTDGTQTVEGTGSNSITVLAVNIGNVFITPVTDDDSDVTLTVTANFDSPEGSGSVSTTTTVVIDAVADVPNLTLDGAAANDTASGDEDTAIALPDIAAALNDTDGSETLTLTVSGVPTGATLSAGVDLGSGVWNLTGLTQAQLNALTITPPLDFSGDFTLTVTATATEGATVAGGGELTEDNNVATKSFDIDVTVAPTPVVSIADAADVTEGGTSAFVVTLSNPSQSSVV
ncbi:MAG: hypothetical protein IH904_06060, partial [Proteobacteria bacterium]|nr:hypothetical protein [Pseudomonadota bacterium]